jgi:hypothetical protein
MTELASVSAASRNRLVQDSLRQRDQVRAEITRTQVRSFDDNLRQRELIEADTGLQARRVKDRRDIIEADRAVSDQLRDQQRTLDFINNDNGFILRGDAIEGELNASRDSREINEGRLLRGIAGDRNDALEFQSLEQRNEDLRSQLIDRQARITARRLQDRSEGIRQEAQLRRSLEQIRAGAANSHTGAEAPRGGVLDVSG